MIKLDLQYGGQIRIWDKKLDSVRVENIDVSEKVYFSSESDGGVMPVNNVVVAEIFLPRSGRDVYGLLGCEYEKSGKKDLVVSIPGNDIECKRIFSDSIIFKFDLANVGFKKEYSKFILDAISERNERNKLALSGELNFCYGAFSEVSSNGWVFQKLTTILIELLGVNLNEITQEMICDVLR